MVFPAAGLLPPPWYDNCHDGSPYTQIGEKVKRRFIPQYSAAHRHVAPDHLIIYNPRQHVSHLQILDKDTYRPTPDQSTVVINIDGACRDHGKPYARASWGVFFGPGSCLNYFGLLDRGALQTNNRAEIEALAQAIRIIQDPESQIIRASTKRDVYIATDSEYLVKSMSQWMEVWNDNQGRSIVGKPIAHYSLLKEIFDTIEECQELMNVRFWHVRREHNWEADALANRALDEMKGSAYH